MKKIKEIFVVFSILLIALAGRNVSARANTNDACSCIQFKQDKHSHDFKTSDISILASFIAELEEDDENLKDLGFSFKDAVLIKSWDINLKSPTFTFPPLSFLIIHRCYISFSSLLI